MNNISNGTKIRLINGDDVTVINKLGEGGQGIVFRVNYKENEYALKWYLPSFLRGISAKNSSNVKKFYKNLENNVNQGAPSDHFLWPLAVTELQNGSYGYLMELRPSKYQCFTKLLNAKVKFKNTSVVINATMNMVSAFQALHRKGYSYQDLNDGNFFVDVNNGEILVCDNDNVAPYGESFGIGGKSRYMAPEIVLGERQPGIRTDTFSLSVVLFMFFFLSHPLEGARVAGCPCLTDEKEKIFYASDPVFICDPQNSTNRPVRGIHNNVINLWPQFPSYLHDMFIKAFCEGCRDESDRLTEAEWKKGLFKLNDDLIQCPKCAEEFFSSMANGNVIKCGCNYQINKPLSLNCKEYEIPLIPGKVITDWHLDETGDYKKTCGIVIQNKNTPNLWGIRNNSERSWIARFPNGEEKTINKNGVVPVLKGVKIAFGTRKVEII